MNITSHDTWPWMLIGLVMGHAQAMVGQAIGFLVMAGYVMLESMIAPQMPTSAEVSDVATAVFDGADAIMLSAESAVGQYPVDAIQMMDRIAIQVESDPSYETIIHTTEFAPQATGADAIAAAAYAIANTDLINAFYPVVMTPMGPRHTASALAMISIFAPLAFVLVLEGLLPFLNPAAARRIYLQLSTLAPRDLRIAGLVSMLAGLVLLTFVRSGT